MYTPADILSQDLLDQYGALELRRGAGPAPARRRRARRVRGSRGRRTRSRGGLPRGGGKQAPPQSRRGCPRRRKTTTLGMWYVRGQIGSVVQCTARCISSAPLLSPLRLRLPHPAQPPPPPARSSGDRARSPAAAGLHPVEHRELLLPLGHVAGGLVDGGRHLQDALLVLDRQRAEAHEREVAAKQLVVFRS